MTTTHTKPHVAQQDRAGNFYFHGRGFESSRAGHTEPRSNARRACRACEEPAGFGLLTASVSLARLLASTGAGVPAPEVARKPRTHPRAQGNALASTLPALVVGAGLLGAA